MEVTPAARAMAGLADAGGQLVSVRARVTGGRALVRVEMPDPGAAGWARGFIRGLGFTLGGNDTPWETQVVFSVPVAALTSSGRTSVAGAGPSFLGPAPPAPPPNS